VPEAPAANPLARYEQKNGDIGLKCTGKENSHDSADSNFIFLLSREFEIGEYLKIEDGGTQQTAYQVIDSGRTTDDHYIFRIASNEELQILSITGKNFNDRNSRSAYGEWGMAIDRKTLDLALTHEGGLRGYQRLSHQCEKLQPDLFAKEIFNRVSAAQKSRSQNKI
jgi:hypothetical protein